MFDLDGVVYVGDAAVPGVASSIERLRALDVHIAFVTNNASRTPEAVAHKLTTLGVAAGPHDVVTSAQAAASLVVSRFGVGVHAYALGGASLAQALSAAGAEVVQSLREADVVVSGYGPDVLWRDIMQAARVVRAGVPYVASNADLTIPTAEGLAPGHGVLVRTISEFAQVRPLVAGKPEPPLMEETIRRIGGSRPLMVGDRLDTDIEGANRLDVPALLVLTGVSQLPDLVTAPPELRPTYLSPHCRGLFEPHPVPAADGGRARLGGWSAAVVQDRLEVTGSGSAADWWRVAVCAAWNHLDTTGQSAEVSGIAPPGTADGAAGR